MSLSALPSELIDLVVSQIDAEREGDDYDALSKHESSLASLALVSKRFTPHARKYLYDRPLLTQQVPNWRAAVQFVDGISANGRAIGKTIESLSGILRWYRVLLRDRNPPKLPYQSRGCTEAFSWYLQVLRLCPRLGVAELFFENPIEMSKALEAIRASATTTLCTLVFPSYRHPLSPTKWYPSSKLVMVALANPVLIDVECLDLRDISFPSSTVPRTFRPLEQRLRILSVQGSRHGVNLSDCSSLLPRNLSYLTSVHFTTLSPYSDPELLTILKRLTPSIQSIRIYLKLISRCSPILSTYLPPPANLPFPGESFSKFSNLSSFVLHAFVGPSLNLLAQLSTSCPFLTNLDFFDSFWVHSQPSLPFSATNSFLDTIVPSDKLLAELIQFRYLRSINLGILPTTDSGRMKSVEKAMKERGVTLNWQRCRRPTEICWECGGFHLGTGTG
ncbi:hypothetical protein JCM5350_002603 [Sporobolomyces pararoseus]